MSSEPRSGPAAGLHAVVDESLSNAEHDPDTYMLAAAVIAVDDLHVVRAQVGELRLKGQKKVHWHEEDDKRRHHIMSVVAALPIQHLIVVRDGHPDEGNERRRRLCLEQLLWHLYHLGVDTVTFESRGAADDRRDMNAIGGFRAQRLPGALLRFDHRTGPSDPALWVPDAICGAYTRHRTGEPAFLSVLDEDRLLIVPVPDLP